jgi:5-methylcytosine-specific restriction endonuclease McrA
MSASAKKWAIKARAELMAILGPVCAWCGATEDLTFDCVVPTGDDHHRGSTDQRMCFYRHQHFEHGNVQVLCDSCNAKKGDAVTDFRRPHDEMNWEHTGEFPPPF